TEVKVGDVAPDFTVLANDLSEKSLKDYEGKVKLIATVPSVDTGVCSEETHRFNKEADKLDNVQVLTISMDLPLTQSRWWAVEGVKNHYLLADHRDAYMRKKYGTLSKELRLNTRAVFVVDADNKVQYAQYVSAVTNHPDYDAALEAAKKA